MLRDAARRLIDNTSGDKQRSERQHRGCVGGDMRQEMASEQASGCVIGPGEGAPQRGKLVSRVRNLTRVDKIYT